MFLNIIILYESFVCVYISVKIPFSKNSRIITYCSSDTAVYSSHLARDLRVTVGTLAEKSLKTGPVVWTGPDPFQQALFVKQPPALWVLVAGSVRQSLAQLEAVAQALLMCNICVVFYASCVIWKFTLYPRLDITNIPRFLRRF